MSAAEKLKQIRADGDPWPAFDALPQIVAVVEAAERADLAYFTVRDDTPAEAMARLATALAALDEKLTGAEGAPRLERTK